MAHRFFIPPGCITLPEVILPGDIGHQIRNVLRLRPDDEIIVLDGSGEAWQVVLTQVDKREVRGRIRERYPLQSEPRLQLSLYQGMLKGQKFEWILQKGTELGIFRFVPVICQRAVVREADTIHKKYTRWQEIIREAAEQSGRGKLPHLEPALPLAEALVQAQGATVRVMAWEEAHQATLKEVLREVEGDELALFIGPEGGFTAGEARSAQENNIRLITLGPRVLRAETASLAACAAIFYEKDEWRQSLVPVDTASSSS